MAQVRKTRQQKIQISQRQANQRQYEVKVDDVKSSTPDTKLDSTENTLAAHITAETGATQAYVFSELRRISWASAVCVLLLLVASVFLSELPFISSLRESLGLPQLKLL